MPRDLAALVRHTADGELPALRNLSETLSAVKPAGDDSWSPKEELGHLIDSAANNHIRFVLAATEPEMRGLPYAQNAWVDLHGYQEMPWTTVVDFWYRYNSFLAELVDRIPAEKLDTKCFIGTCPNVTLGFLIEDYVLHMRHHIDHLLARPAVTAYPAPATAKA